jgi:vacuolar protein sorting-associated protein 13A/C
MKGTYKGISGLVIKPISGSLDLISKTSEGIKNTAGPKQKKVKKIRFMRPFYGKLQLIRYYNAVHAEVKLILDKIDKGAYQQQTFLDAILYNELGEKKQKVIVLSEEAFMVRFQIKINPP